MQLEFTCSHIHASLEQTLGNIVIDIILHVEILSLLCTIWHSVLFYDRIWLWARYQIPVVSPTYFWSFDIQLWYVKAICSKVRAGCTRISYFIISIQNRLKIMLCRK